MPYVVFVTSNNYCLRYSIGKLLRRILLSRIISEGSRSSHCGTNSRALEPDNRQSKVLATFPVYPYVIRGQEEILVDLRYPSFQAVRQKYADVFPPRL